MTQTETDRLSLPLLAAGQAQKDIVHNEALLRLDMACQASIQSADLATPPASPAPGDCWIVGAAPTGPWTGRADAIAGWTLNGWRFVAPGAGWRAWVLDRAHMMRFDGASWVDEAVRSDGYFVAGMRVIAARQSPIAGPSGGATVDVEGRVAIEAILATLRAHGLIGA